MAKRAGREQELPVRLVKKKVPTEQVTVVIVEDKGRWLIHRRPPQGMLASMWEFPNGTDGLDGVRQLTASAGVMIDVDDQPVGTLKHVFSHKIWQMTIYEGRRIGGELAEKEDWQWLPRRDLTAVPWAGPHGKITAMAR